MENASRFAGIVLLIAVVAVFFVLQQKNAAGRNDPKTVCTEDYIKKAFEYKEKSPNDMIWRLRKVVEVCEAAAPAVYAGLCEERMKVRDLKYCEEGLEKYPYEPRLHLLMGFHYGATGDIEQSCEHFEMAKNNGMADVVAKMGEKIKEQCPDLEL